MKFRRKMMLVVGVLILMGAGTWLLWPQSTISLTQVDQLGTQIQPVKTVEGRVGSRLERQQLTEAGYQLTAAPNLKFRTAPQAIVVRYRPTLTSQQLQHKLKNYRYIGASFQVLNTGLGRHEQNYNRLANEMDRMRLLLSNDGIHWDRLAVNYPNIAVRDPNIIKIGDRWWIIYTAGLMWTTDFQKWHQVINAGLNPNGQFQKVWAPEIYRAADGTYHVVSANSTDGMTFQLYSYGFSPQTGVITDPQPVNVAGDFPNLIDPHIVYRQGIYELWAKDEQRHQLVRAVSADGMTFTGTQPVALPIRSGEVPEGPTELDHGKQHLLYFDLYDQHETFYGVQAVVLKDDQASSKRVSLQADFLVRHFSVFAMR
ncbi:hypothetical protein [Levilactobacillus koreensis]|uniref:hypothetical protein n=1 Tax=Levilactobacillus koreensis TaxID=637971 RepID=UPI0012E0B29D|nr:hypothetical protein [Levilactobacillus koreensis]